MKNKTKNSIVLAALAIMILGTARAEAYVPGVWDPTPRVNTGEAAFTKVPATYDAPMTTQTSTTVVNNQNTSTTNTAPKKTTTTTVKKSNTTSNTSNITTPANVRELPPVVTTDNGLAALSLQGSGSFMPSSIWQWMLLVLLILIIIIIARMLSRSHQEVHTVTAH